MRIGINCQPLAMEHFSGISNYVNEVLKVWALEDINSPSPKNEIFLLSSKDIRIDFDIPDNWTIVIDEYKKGLIWETLGVCKTIKKYKLDVYWGTNYILPLVNVHKCKYFVTIYDLALMRFPQVGIFKLKLRAQYLARYSAKISKKVFTISDASASDIMDLFKTSKNKIVNTYCGAGTSNNAGFSNSSRKLILDELNITPQRYFLFISTLEPRKNIITIIKAFEKFMEEDSTFKLVLAGANGWKTSELDDAIANSPYKDRIIITGYISAEQKDALLFGATAFVYPSLYEGFGLPILEAMEYELPVITARVSSMPEVGGEAAFYIDDPTDADSLAKQMKTVCELTEDELQIIKKQMLDQYQKFTWNQTAQIILTTFQNIL